MILKTLIIVEVVTSLHQGLQSLSQMLKFERILR
jgi:hypothetical protein